MTTLASELPSASPDPGAGESALFDSLVDCSSTRQATSGTAPAEITGITEFPPLFDETRVQLGFTIADIDQDAWTGWGDGGHPFQVLHGRFDRLAIEQAVHADPVSAGLLATVSHGGVDYYQWDAGSAADSAGTAKSLGPGHQLASLGEYLTGRGQRTASRP